MHEAILYEKLKNKTVRCHVCQRECLIPEGKTGYCQTRLNQDGILYTTIYGVISSINNDPIEKKPVFHFRPGSFCLSIGTFGCNFRCLFCQNYEIAWADGVSQGKSTTETPPEKIIELAKKYNSAGIAITYNEPVIWLEYSLDVFKLAKEVRPPKRSDLSTKLYTVWVTNGYATKDAIDIIAPYLDVYRVDLKSFADNFYQKLIKLPKAQGIFDMTKYVHDKYPKIHLECITNIIPTWNDDPKMLTKIAKWIKNNLGEKTPWHVTRFFPYAKLTNLPPTPEEILFKAREIGLKEGLKFVYIGNMEVDKEDDTLCPQCGNLVIRRDSYKTKIIGVNPQGNCVNCDEILNLRI